MIIGEPPAEPEPGRGEVAGEFVRADLIARVDELIVAFHAEGANLAVRSGTEAVDEGVSQLAERHVLVQDRHRLRVRDRIVLRYYARTVQHLMTRRRGATH